ncbi:hypothetical protein [Streptomyces sp. NPDC006552]|uniref:hypothetical protein n=1 Tax=Streptomyces sp. NPDC006552 TaxID=3157179 RepID=UPI0033A398CC
MTKNPDTPAVQALTVGQLREVLAAYDDDTFALGPRETFDWPMIESERSDQARTRLGSHGMQRDPDTGTVTCPAGMDTARAEALWDQVKTEMDNWVLDLIDDVRQGKPTAPDAERTAGHTWVRPL